MRFLPRVVGFFDMTRLIIVRHAQSESNSAHFYAASTNVNLTELGRKQAEDVLEKHTILSNWLISLGVTKEIADEDACRMEHDISAESFSAIKAHILNLS